jgi:tetratricopeptide (TPR) repeat protein
MLGKFYKQGGEEKITKSVEGFQQELSQIRAGYKWANGQMATNSLAANLCESYPSSSPNLLMLLLPPKELATWLRLAITITQEQSQNEHINNLAAVLITLGEFTEAIEWCEPILKDNLEPQIEQSLLGNLGNAYMGLGQTHKALQYQEHALEISHLIEDKRIQAGNHNNLGIALTKLEQHEKAADHYQQAFALAEEVGDLQIQMSALGNIGVIYKNLKQYKDALEYYEACFHLAQQLNDLDTQAYSLGNMGTLYLDQELFHDAEAYLIPAVTIFHKIGNRGGEATFLSALANAYARQAEYEKALEHYSTVLKINRETSQMISEANTLNDIALIQADLGNSEDAIELLNQALNIVDEPKLHGKILSNIGIIYLNWSKLSEAIEYCRQALILRHETRDFYGAGVDLTNLGLIAVKKNQYRIGLKLYQSAKERFEIIKETKMVNLVNKRIQDLEAVLDRL